MSQLDSSKTVDPFGEVNVFNEPDGTIRIKAIILMRPQVEGAQTGLAIDGSNSMTQNFGVSGSVSSLFGTPNNLVQPVARTMAKYLANFDSDGETSVIYWACGVGGGEIQELGEMNAEKAGLFEFSSPSKLGTGTQLLPAIKYFTEKKFPSAPWAIFVFITDGAIEDLQNVKAYTFKLAEEISQGKRNYTKFVLIGLGEEAERNKFQMEELDDINYGGLRDKNGDEIDLWDHKMAKDMKKLEEIFAEAVSDRIILAPSAIITDSNGNAVQPKGRASYADGLPALLEFTMPSGSHSFTLTLPTGKTITQQIM